MTDLLGGHNLVQFTPIPVARGPVDSGLIRALGVTGLKRSVQLPDVPTIAESGLPGFEVSLRYGILAPAGTPRPIIDKLNKHLDAALATDEVKKRILNAGAEPVAGTPEQYADVIDREEKMWSELIKPWEPNGTKANELVAPWRHRGGDPSDSMRRHSHRTIRLVPSL